MISQSKTIPASIAKNSFGAVINQVYTGEFSEIIVVNHGEPVAAIVGVKDLESLRKLREKQKQEEALARLRNVRAQVQARIKGKLSEKKVEELANRFSRDFVADLEKEGKIRFEK